MSTWAPVVYAPTYRVDFRLICAPRALAHGALRKWVTSFVVPTLYAPDQTREFQRWALFQNDAWRVVGVGCRATDVAHVNEVKVRDDHSRRLWLFVGYAAQRDGTGHYPCPPMCDTSLAPFKDLYDFVLRHWDDERPVAPEEMDSYPVEFDISHRQRASNQAYLNVDSHKMALWPDSKAVRARLWREISASTATRSLLLGFAKQRYALETPYLNGTAQDIKSEAVIPK